MAKLTAIEAHGRKFKGGCAHPHPYNNDGVPFVQTIIDEPLTVFEMTPDQALSFGKELTEAGEQAKRILETEEAKKEFKSKYKTIFDKDGVKVMRRKTDK